MSKIEDLLQVAAADPHASAWSDLYAEVIDHGECDPASYFLLPLLADIAAGFDPADRGYPFLLAGCIAFDLAQASRDRYAEALVALRRLMVETLSTPTNPMTFGYRLQALLALEGDPVWGNELDRIFGEEYEVECPSCEASLFIVFGERGHGPAVHGPSMMRARGSKIITVVCHSTTASAMSPSTDSEAARAASTATVACCWPV